MDATFQALNVSDSLPRGGSAFVWLGHLPARPVRSIEADASKLAGIVCCRSRGHS